MSRETVELARGLYAAGVDLAAVFADPKALAAFRAGFEPLVHPEFETVVDPDFRMLAGDPADASRETPYYGFEGFAEGFGDWLSGWESWTVVPLEFIDAGEARVVVELDITGRSRAQGVELTSRGANVVTFRDGRLTRLELFLRFEDALKVVGSEE